MSGYHVPVLLKESVDALIVDRNGIYVDVTFGGGGHSREIMNRLGSEGRLFAVDQDEDAKRNLISDDRFLFVHSNFRYVKNFLNYYGVEKIDGLLADLGVSSHEFDIPERGFSFRFDAPLDMRMNQDSELTAAKVVNEYSEEDLKKIFYQFGELKNAKKLASLIVKERAVSDIMTTGELKKTLSVVLPKKTEAKFLAKVFQALRIEVNGEMEVLKDLLENAKDLLRPGGRLVVMSYHSLEDRLVKNYTTKGNFEGQVEQDFYGNVKADFKPVVKKVIVPNEDEIECNPRARSAKLRILERL